MADNVKFKEWQCHDDRRALTQEDMLQRLLGFAGIHDTTSLAEIDEDFAGGTLGDNNMEGAEGTWSITSGALQGVGDGLAQWYKIRHTEEIELGFVATFDKTGNRGAFLFCSDSTYNGYLVYWTGTAVGVSEIDGTDETTLIEVPLAETGVASVTVAVWPLRYTSIDTIDDLAIGLWFDNKHLLTHVIAYTEKGKQIGFGVYEADTVTFDNLRVAQLHQVVEWASVDPGEAVAAGVSRIIANERIRLLARYDGTVKMWYAGDDTTTDWTVPDGRCLQAIYRYSHVWPSHLRLVGALHEANVFRAGTQGHIFTVGSDPNALSEDETIDRAERRHKEAEEMAYTAIFAMAPNPVLEPEDIIDLDGPWRIVTIDYRAVWGGVRGSAPVLESTLEARECL